jgi:transcription initiation factor TFIIE subunit alpha
MQIKLLKDVVSYISGPASIDIVDLLYGKENVNEFLIAKKLNITINQARNILYKLGDEGLVSFIRKKDKKNGGWYTYFWTLDVTKSLFVLRNRIIKEIENLEKQLGSKRTKQFYYCPNCDLEMTEENALLYDFTCPECGEVFKLKDNTGVIKEIGRHVEDLKSKLGLIDIELEILNKKAEASKERRRKIEEKKKKKERMERSKARALLKKKEAKGKAGKGFKKKIKKGPKRKSKKPAKRKVRKLIKKKKGKKKIVKKGADKRLAKRLVKKTVKKKKFKKPAKKLRYGVKVRKAFKRKIGKRK